MSGDDQEILSSVQPHRKIKSWWEQIMERMSDGSAGDVDYSRVGSVYSNYRRPDSGISKFVWDALGNSKTVLNVGAGAGSYEPTDREVTAVEPSQSMRAQRPDHLVRAIDAIAERLPFADRSFDASMSTFSVHQWQDLAKGLREMRRVTRGPVVILTCDPDALNCFWLSEYIPEVIAVESRRYPKLTEIRAALGPNVVVHLVPISLNCSDGFGEAYYGRPEKLLEPGAQLACSAWSFVNESVTSRFNADLSCDLNNGEWDRRYGHMRKQPVFFGSLRMIVATPDQPLNS